MVCCCSTAVIYWKGMFLWKKRGYRRCHEAEAEMQLQGLLMPLRGRCFGRELGSCGNWVGLGLHWQGRPSDIIGARSWWYRWRVVSQQVEEEEGRVVEGVGEGSGGGGGPWEGSGEGEEEAGRWKQLWWSMMHRGMMKQDLELQLMTQQQGQLGILAVRRPAQR